MPRIPYVYMNEGESDVADRIRSRRADGKLLELDAMLLNAPQIADGYNALLRAVRMESVVPDALKELVILRVAALNSAAFEWIHHEPIGRKAGLSTTELATIRDTSRACSSGSTSTLSPLYAAALVYTDYITRSIRVPQDVFDNLRAQLGSDQQMVEVTVTAATYNMVSRVLVALDISDKANTEVPSVDIEPVD
ncbi:carboxymuconolactone decarboxylase [Rickenella mellea]|uniref:Carboxymuconolactone decarboxylase n=1 Tax=Rickenella mellea TaxID=50990 RepID=A0A4Y7Q2A8_9AGAM|nr:carboxymuconolactone decarboxylase [Rickenella mellea]